MTRSKLTRRKSIRRPTEFLIFVTESSAWTSASSSLTTWFWNSCTIARIRNLWVQEQHGPRRTSTGVPRILVLYTSVFTYVMMSTSTNSSTTLKLKPRGGGMTNVRANRTVAVVTEEGRKRAPLDTLSNKITEGKSNGWALIYARGPEGEALEFVQ